MEKIHIPAPYNERTEPTGPVTGGDLERRASQESETGALTVRLDALEKRLSAMESAVRALRSGPDRPAEPEGHPQPAGAPQPEAAVGWGETLPLVGRTFLVLAGAFLLRALTEAGVLPQLAGAALGILYALVWTVLADRSAAAGQRTSANLQGLATAIIAFPLLWEATAKFGFLSPGASAVGLAAVTVPGLFVASRQRLRQMAWTIALGAAVTTMALAVGTKMVVLFAACLLLLGGAMLWLGYVRGWYTLGWLVAVLVDVNMILLTAIVLLGDPSRVERILRPASLLGLQLSLIVVYLGSFAVRTVARGRNARAPEISQGIAALLIGLVGAVVVTRSASLSSLPLVIVSLLLAAGCYAASFTLTGTSIGKRRNFLFYTTVGLVAGLVACGALSPNPVRVVAFGLAGLVTAVLGAYAKRVTLTIHGAVFVVAAALASGLLPSSIRTLVEPSPTLEGFDRAALVSLVVAGLFCCLPSKRHGRSWGRFALAPKTVVVAIFVLGIAAVVVALAAPVLPTTDSTLPDRAALAALRTGVLALGVLALAWLGRSPRFVEAGLLVYPLLVAGGLKLLLEDLRAGRPATLVISLALYGGAMMLAPRLRRDGASTAETPPAPEATADR
jgi:hypothetical protein